MDKFLKELESQDIHLRDRWQFELKTDIEPRENLSHCDYTQEFFIFIPDALQINQDSYTKEQFYQDQTNFIRYKTPVFSFEELNDLTSKASPFSKLDAENFEDSVHFPRIEYELKLLGNIFRSTLREEALECYRELNKKEFTQDSVNQKLLTLLDQLKRFHFNFESLKSKLYTKPPAEDLKQSFDYVEEFIEDTSEFYLTGLLYKIEELKKPKLENTKNEILKYLFFLVQKIPTFSRRESMNGVNDFGAEAKAEYILYRRSLLNKYVLDALFLSTYRASPQRFQHIIGGIAAGIAMLFFFVLFVWQGKIFGINTMEFILVTVVLYILKDRIKEIIKNISYKLAVGWIFDYSTQIKSHDGSLKLGTLKESFNYVNPSDLPEDIRRVRNQEFHAILSDFQRPERIIHYVKSINIRLFEETHSKRMGLNNIFRLNIHDFLEKAGDPEQHYWVMDEKTEQMQKILLPKVYHINIVIKNIFYNDHKDPYVEIKKYRLIVNKNGIKRIESLNPS